MKLARSLALGGVVFGLVVVQPRAAMGQGRAACAAAYTSGQARRDEGKLLEARAQFSKCASTSCAAALRKDCLEWLRQLENIVPSLVFRAVDASDGSDLPNVKIEIDGSPVKTALGKPMAVDPGQHTLRVLEPNHERHEEPLVVAAGERNRTVIVRLQRVATAAVAVPVVAVPSVPKLSKDPGEDNRPSFVPPLVLAGAGVAAVGTAAYFYVSGFERGTNLKERCGTTPDCPKSETAAMRTRFMLGDVFAGAGLVSIGIATYLLLTRHAPPPASARLELAPVRGGAHAAATFAF